MFAKLPWTGSKEEKTDDDPNNNGDTKPATRTEEEGGVVFTSSKCPPAPGLDMSCELPFGFVWTPMCNPYNKNNAVVHKLPPVLCLNCLCYLNPYAEINTRTGVWKCPLCEHENIAPKSLLKNCPALSSNVVEYHQPVPVPEKNNKGDGDDDDDEEEDIDDEDELLESGGVLAKDTNVFEGTTYYLVVDSHLDGPDGLAIGNALNQIITSSSSDDDDDGRPTRIALVVFDSKVKIYRLGVPGVVSADVYEALDDDAGDDVLLERKKEIEDRAYIVEIDPSEEDGVSSTLERCLSAVFDMPGPPAKAPSRLEMLQKKKEARLRKLATNGTGGGGGSGGRSGKRSSGGGFTNGTAAHHPSTTTATASSSFESPWVKQRGQKGHPQRCTADAIQAALDMIGVVDPSQGTRVLLFTNGCPNAGEGSVVQPHDVDDNPRKKHDVIDPDMLSKSVEYFDLMANVALEAGVGIDVFCAGANELGLPAYQSLVDPSGGYVVPQLSFATPQFEYNLSHLLEQTYLASSKYDVAAESDDPPEVYLDIRTDSFMDPAQLVGPGEIMPVETDQMMDNELEAYLEASEFAEENDYPTENLPMEEAVALSLTRIKLSRFDPLTTVAVMCQINDSMEDEDEAAFFQFVTRYHDKEGENIITRVVSFRLDVAEDVAEFVSCVDDEAVSVVLAKSAVYRAVHGRDETEGAKDMTVAGDAETLEKLSYEAQLDMDATIQRISGAYRLLGLEETMKNIDLSDVTTRPRGSKKSSSLDFAFPPQLKDTLNRLYHLRRGPLISPGPMSSIDDRAGTRGLCLRFPLEDCLQMMAPSVWTTGDLEGIDHPYANMEETLAETLALWDSCLVAADCYDKLYVWIGRYCAGTPYDSIREEFKDYLEDESSFRFPMPEVQLLYDGDSESRRFTARLAPSHADPQDHQLAHFPGLEDLSEDSLERLHAKFKFYDSASDASFRKWFWSVASATNASKDDGVSLCE